MATNFRIYRHRTKDCLHLKLDGDFDGNSAHELINALKEYGSDSHQIFIDTNDLNTVHPFGRDVLQKNINQFNRKLKSLIFIGEYEDQIKPN